MPRTSAASVTVRAGRSPPRSEAGSSLFSAAIAGEREDVESAAGRHVPALPWTGRRGSCLVLWRLVMPAVCDVDVPVYVPRCVPSEIFFREFSLVWGVQKCGD